ncbi:TIGR04222 domain-containing membrane protein [Streptomyces sp. t39]|uniref:TIGR04222 domain-containing membrane protein n=1 Tax=Streptomyces sp. t39 TaxID=1828156 RepID=UPI0011CE4899|nr:TIGR04222 domain-containing membrane protein [Streptomyces sp. t39]TXS57381.1 TIGR04222 domain-containing membrane protein [Streptomyces sp. t39]
MVWLLLLALAWAVTAVSCLRLCLAAADVPRLPSGMPGPADGRGADGAGLTLHEAAFLAGGPGRVTDLTLVSMHRQRRLLLAHTGWTTVVDPDTEDALERSVIAAAGPAGQERTSAVRTAVAADEAVRAVGDRLVTVGLAVPDRARAAVVSAIRAVRTTSLLIPALAVCAVLTLPAGREPGPVAVWFTLPLALTLGALAMAAMEVRPYTRFASPLGGRLLSAFAERAAAAGQGTEQARLTAVALHGVGVLDDPQLRVALTGGRPAHRVP